MCLLQESSYTFRGPCSVHPDALVARAGGHLAVAEVVRGVHAAAHRRGLARGAQQGAGAAGRLLEGVDACPAQRQVRGGLAGGARAAQRGTDDHRGARGMTEAVLRRARVAGAAGADADVGLVHEVLLQRAIAGRATIGPVLA